MAQIAQLTIIHNLETGAVKIGGPIDNPVLAKGMLDEARRIIDRRANERDEKAEKGADLVVVGVMPKLKGAMDA